MQRYRSGGNEDDPSAQVGDENFIGVDEYSDAENVRPNYVQSAVNVDFTTGNAKTRGGFVCLPELGAAPFGQAFTYHAIDASTANFVDVSYGQGLFVAVGNAGAIYSSPDAVTWTVRTPPNTPNYTDIAFANGVFIVVGTLTGSGNPPIARSTDGITWSLPTTYYAGTQTGVSYGNGIWVSVSNKQSHVSTDNGVNWTNSATINELEFVQGLSFGNGVFTAVTAIGTIVYSYDGLTWTTSNILYSSSAFVDVAFGNQTFVTLAGDGTVYTSSDGISWSKKRESDGETWRTLTYGNGMFVAFADTAGGDGAMYSINGTGWIKLTGIPNYAWYGSTYGNDLFVAVGSSGASMSASNVSQAVFASGLFSDPNNANSIWMMLLSYNKVGFYSYGHSSRTVSLGGYTVNAQSTIVQANNQVFIFRGDDAKPLYWDGDWNTSFTVVPDTTLPATYNSIPNSNQATYYQNRLWIRDGKDSVAASDVLAFTDYDPLANEFNLNTGNSDYVVATFPFGQTSLVCFKNKSIQLLQQVDGALTDVVVTEITRQVGLIGINAVTSVGPDLAYVSYGNINLLTLTTTNNALQHKTLPLSAAIRKIMDRVNWQVGYKISLGYWNNKLYVALPLDNSQYCNAVVVYNFISESWFGEWTPTSTLNMCIQGWAVNDYLGLQRLHAITEDGRIFVTDEGQNDISGTTVAEISMSITTRAYNTSDLNHFQRRLYVDIATNRPDFSVSSYTEGVSEESTLLTDQTYTRSQSWLFNDASYDLTNANNDFNRAYRRDYSTGPASVQCGTGFLPEAVQFARLPMITQRQGRLSWLKLSNTQGVMQIYGVGFEARPGQRSNTVQV